MGRPPKTGIPRRLSVRVDPKLVALLDSYTPDQVSEILNRGLDHFTPGIDLGGALVSVVRPPKPVTFTVCRLIIQGSTVRALFPEKREDFKAVVKSLGYEWSNPYWERAVPTEVLTDRSAELGHKLLLTGFCVQVHNATIKEKVIAANYEPEHYRRIGVGDHTPWVGWFQIRWPRSEDLFDHAAKITCSKWSSGAMYVPIEGFREVQDFAEMHSFWLSQEAIALMEKATQAWEDALLICPEQHLKEKRRAAPPPPDLSLAAVPDSLRDDED